MRFVSPLKRWLSIAVLSASALTTPASATPLLIGSATLNLANDLTLIQDGSHVLQFLDLTSTQGMTVANALGAFGGDGFHWATGAEVAQLYGAFGIAYQSVVADVHFLTVPAAQATAYTSYLGITGADAAIGWIDDNTDASFHTYSCISVLTCGFGAFIANNTFNWPSEPRVGVFLVRSAANPSPEPGTAALIGIGLAGILALRRRSGREC